MGTNGPMAFGVDPRRKERYSLRQSRYWSLAEDVSGIAAVAKAQGRRLKLLDVGTNDGVSRRYIEVQPDSDNIDYYAADWLLRDNIYKKESWHALYEGDLMNGYPQIPGEAFDVVICEQVLEHLPKLEIAMQTLSRVLVLGGTMFVGVPTFPLGLYLIRKYIVPRIDAVNPWAKRRSHVQVFSQRAFSKLLSRHAGVEIQDVRGFRIVSGGILAPLENLRWWWQLNRRVGAAVPGLCIEVQVVAKKRNRVLPPIQCEAA
jgi:SAM-dependent methyltransferase